MVGNDEKQALKIAQKWFILNDNKQKYINLIKNSNSNKFKELCENKLREIIIEMNLIVWKLNDNVSKKQSYLVKKTANKIQEKKLLNQIKK